MGSFQHNKRSDNKRGIVEVRCGIFSENCTEFFLFLKAVVNIPTQIVMISPRPSFRKMIISQLELGSPVIGFCDSCHSLALSILLPSNFSCNIYGYILIIFLCDVIN